MNVKRLLSVLLCLALLPIWSLLPVGAAAASDGASAGEGGASVWDGVSYSRAWYDDAIAADSTATSFYISTAADLAGLSKITSDSTAPVDFSGMTVYLSGDIYLNSYTMGEGDVPTFGENPNNWNAYMIKNFAGTFDGQGYTIHGLYISNSANTGTGLFSSFSSTSPVIRNLKLDGVSISAARSAGAIVGVLGGSGSAASAKITNCHVRGSVKTTSGLVGGIAGLSTNTVKWYGVIDGCSVRGQVGYTGSASNDGNGTFFAYAGGIIPFLRLATGSNTAYIKNCYVYADVTAAGGAMAHAGGIVGLISVGSKCKVYIQNCAASGDVTAQSYAGGLIGEVKVAGGNSSCTVTVDNCYAAGAPAVTGVNGSGESFAGRLIAYVNKGTGTLTTSGGNYALAGTAAGVAGNVNSTAVSFTDVTAENAVGTDAASLLAALNTRATAASYTLWIKGHLGYPVHEGLAPWVEPTVTYFPDAASVKTLGLLAGAEARVAELASSGLRFTLAVNGAYLDEVIATYTEEGTAPTVTAGILILPTDYFDTYPIQENATSILANEAVKKLSYTYTEQVLRQESESGAYLVRASIVNLYPQNYVRSFSALAYLSVETASGEAVMLEAPYVAEHNARCIQDVALAAYDDRDENGESEYSDVQLATLRTYLNGAVELETIDNTPVFIQRESAYYSNPYTVAEGGTPERFTLLAAHLTAESNVTVIYDGVICSTANGLAVAGEGTLTVTPPAAPELELETAITLSPGSVTAWVGFPEDLTLRATVTADDPDQTLRYFSSNEEIVSVSETGSLTLRKEGVAYVFAQATDGSHAVSNKVLVTVEKAPSAASDQLLTLGSTASARVNTAALLADPTGYGTAQLAMWKNNASGAFSITCDDSLTGNFAAWNAMTEKYGIPITFFVPGSYAGADGERWVEQINAGQEVQSHTQRHASSDTQKTWSTAEIWMDYYSSVGSIEAITRTPVSVIAYSYGYCVPEYASLLFMAGRGTTGTPNKGAEINYTCTNSVSKKFTTSFTRMQEELRTLWDAETKVYNVSYVGGWTCYHFHSVSVEAYTTEDGRTISTATEWLDEMFSVVVMPEVNAGRVWADSFRAIAAYGQERDSATLEVLSAGADEITFSLTDRMNDSLYNEALTVKIAVDETWTGVSATQNGEALDARIVTTETATLVYVNAVPDAGTVTVSRTN